MTDNEIRLAWQAHQRAAAVELLATAQGAAPRMGQLAAQAPGTLPPGSVSDMDVVMLGAEALAAAPATAAPGTEQPVAAEAPRTLPEDQVSGADVPMVGALESGAVPDTVASDAVVAMEERGAMRPQEVADTQRQPLAGH